MRGLVRRRRAATDERRLSIGLTAQGRRRVAADTVLDPSRRADVLSSLPADTRAILLDSLETLAERAETADIERRSP